MPQRDKRPEADSLETDSLVSLHARAMSHARWAKCDDPTAATAPARAAAEARFVRQVRELFGDLPDEELARRARHLKRAYFTRLAMASAKARRKARQQGDDDAAA